MDHELYVTSKRLYRRWFTLNPSRSGHGYSLLPSIDHQPPQIPFKFIPPTSETDDGNTICINDVLLNDLLMEVLLKLPTTIIVRSFSVCKRWTDIIHSTAFMKKFLDSSLRKPFYLMLTDGETYGHICDLELRKWCSLEIPFAETLGPTIASSSGLICFMPDHKEVYVYNPVTNLLKRLPDLPGPPTSFSTALAISEGRSSSSYNVTIIRSLHGDSLVDWQPSIDEYDSETQKWESRSEIMLQGRRIGSDCVECEGVLYFVVYMADYLDMNPVAICTYNKSFGSLGTDFIELPCNLICIRLMKMKGKVVMVGSVEEQEQWETNGIRVWVLEGRQWAEARWMPDRIWREFKGINKVFACSGFNETIYIQNVHERKLLVFEMGSGQWRWTEMAPPVRRHEHLFFSGICFEPRFDTMP